MVIYFFITVIICHLKYKVQKHHYYKKEKYKVERDGKRNYVLNFFATRGIIFEKQKLQNKKKYLKKLYERFVIC